VPEIFIADPRTFCGSPGANITNGAGKKREPRIKSVSTALVGLGTYPLVGSKDLM
jgi:hypothetical protein